MFLVIEEMISLRNLHAPIKRKNGASGGLELSFVINTYNLDGMKVEASKSDPYLASFLTTYEQVDKTFLKSYPECLSLEKSKLFCYSYIFKFVYITTVINGLTNHSKVTGLLSALFFFRRMTFFVVLLTALKFFGQLTIFLSTQLLSD